MKGLLSLFLVSALSFHEARDAKEKIRLSAASSRGQLHLTLFLHLRPQLSQPPAPYGANTQLIMANEGSMESPQPPLLTDEPGAAIARRYGRQNRRRLGGDVDASSSSSPTHSYCRDCVMV